VYILESSLKVRLVYTKARNTVGIVAYEKFKRTGVRVDGPTLSIVPDGRITLNAAACRILTQVRVTAVVLLWDKSSHTIALKASNKRDSDAFAVSIAPGTYSGSVRATRFLTHIGWHANRRQTVPAVWNASEKMLEAKLPDAFLRTRKAKDEL
jgi:hypothetical protein